MYYFFQLIKKELNDLSSKSLTYFSDKNTEAKFKKNLNSLHIQNFMNKLILCQLNCYKFFNRPGVAEAVL